MCFGCLKEPSHRDGSFEYLQHMFWLRYKKNIFSYALLSGGLYLPYSPTSSLGQSSPVKPQVGVDGGGFPSDVSHTIDLNSFIFYNIIYLKYSIGYYLSFM